jgi:hypothetical protein
MTTAPIVVSTCYHYVSVLEAVVRTKKSSDDFDMVEWDKLNQSCQIVARFQVCRTTVDCHDGTQNTLACHCIVNIGCGGIHLRLLRFKTNAQPTVVRQMLQVRNSCRVRAFVPIRIEVPVSLQCRGPVLNSLICACRIG